MTLQEIIALTLMSIGVFITLVAAIGLERFSDVLARLHVTSKPQMSGLLFTLSGAAVAIGSWSAAGMLLLVLLAQMMTVPVASTMVARAVFRRGFVIEDRFAIDELTPRLARSEDKDDDEDGFVDDFDMPDAADGTPGVPAAQIPDNVMPDHELDDPELVDAPNWDEPEAQASSDPGEGAIDVDLEDETELEAVRIAEEDEKARLARAEAQAARHALSQRTDGGTSERKR